MATKRISWDSGGGYITLTYTGSGNGTIIVESDDNTLGTPRSKTITVQTVGGAITRNLTVSQATCPFPVGDIRNYSYTGSYQEVILPAGKYKLQCWGAQGGTCSDDYAGGKGGYSEGVITLSSTTTVRVYVGGQGGSTLGGFNGGGSSSGSSSYNSGDTYGRSTMGGGGGATDIRLSDGALLSRMIVAGGGSGGAYCYKETTTTTNQWVSVYSDNLQNWWQTQYARVYGGNVFFYDFNTFQKGEVYKFELDGASGVVGIYIDYFMGDTFVSESEGIQSGGTIELQNTSNYDNFAIVLYTSSASGFTGTFTAKHYESVTETITDSDYQTGYAGGGTNGVGYSSSYYGKQNAAGSGGSFGQGANQTTANYRYCSGAGGGGWYGGGGQKSNSSMTYVHYSGGGSGWVNIAANAGNRPSGYTGLELDSGETKAGNTSFPSTGGGTETGHSGNGYAKITRIS